MMNRDKICILCEQIACTVKSMEGSRFSHNMVETLLNLIKKEFLIKMTCKHYCLRLSKDGLGGTYYTCVECGAITRTRCVFDE